MSIIPLGASKENLEKAAGEIKPIFQKVPDFWGDSGKAREIRAILDKHKIPPRSVFYDFTFKGKWSTPVKFSLYHASGSVLATESASTLIGRVNYPKANAYAKFGYLLKEVGIQLRGNMANLFIRHRTAHAFLGFERLK